MKTIAELAGVSVMTVSRVLSGKGICSASTRGKVEGIAKELGYYPNILGRSLLKNRLDMVGIVIPNIIHAFFPYVVNSMEERLAEHGYSVFLCCSRDDPKIEAEKVQMLLGYRVSGIIMLPSLRSTVSKKTAESIIDNGCPLVLVDRLISSIKADSVGWRSAEAMDEIVGHLVKRGCWKFVYCAGLRDEWDSRNRTKDFFKAISKYGANCVWEINAQATDAAMEIEIGRLVESGTAFDAICCATDIHAAAVLFALQKRGIKVPKDVALTGFGGVINTHNSKLSVTTVRQDDVLMGHRAAELIVEQIRHAEKGHTSAKKILLPVSVEYGESSLH